MNNLFSFKKHNSVSKERLQIRNYLLSSFIFTAFALICSRSVVNSVPNPDLANKLQAKLSTCHIIALHIISVSTLIVGISSDKEQEQDIVNSSINFNQKSTLEDN